MLITTSSRKGWDRRSHRGIPLAKVHLVGVLVDSCKREFLVQSLALAHLDLQKRGVQTSSPPLSYRWKIVSRLGLRQTWANRFEFDT